MATKTYMTNFINLTSRVINKSHIVEIIKRHNKYYIHMSNDTSQGFILFPTGGLFNKPNIIEICDKKDKQNYDTVTEFIKNECTRSKI